MSLSVAVSGCSFNRAPGLCPSGSSGDCWRVLDIHNSHNAAVPTFLQFDATGFPTPAVQPAYSPIDYVGAAYAAVGHEMFIFGGGRDRTCPDGVWNDTCVKTDPKTHVLNKVMVFNGTTFRDATVGTLAQRVYATAVSVRQSVYSIPAGCRGPLHAQLPQLQDVSQPLCMKQAVLRAVPSVYVDWPAMPSVYVVLPAVPSAYVVLPAVPSVYVDCVLNVFLFASSCLPSRASHARCSDPSAVDALNHLLRCHIRDLSLVAVGRYHLSIWRVLQRSAQTNGHLLAVSRRVLPRWQCCRHALRTVLNGRWRTAIQAT